MKFKVLADHFRLIESTSSRNDMTELLSKLFAETSADEIGAVMYMLQGKVTPPYEKADFGLGEKMIIRAVVRALQIDEETFQESLKKTGDIGSSAEMFMEKKGMKGTQDMSVMDVFEKLVSITKMSGDGSQDRKLEILSELVKALDPLSCRYLVRIPAQTLRLGFSDMTILDAMSWLLAGNKSLRKDIEKAYHVRPDLGYIAEMLKKHGISKMASIVPHIGTPILMMKAQRLPTPEDIFNKLQTGRIEPKYDGFRLQIHYEKKGKEAVVKLFSRGLDDVTYMYPDIVEGVIKECHADSAILEGEALGFDSYSRTFLPFQETVQRKRKHDIAEKAQEIPLKMFIFELLYVNGESLLKTPLTDRSKKMLKVIKPSGDIFNDTLLLSPQVEMITADDVNRVFEDSISKGLEGIMVKKLDGTYEPGARGWNWIKFKRSYSAKIDDTLDCVVMGYDRGKGKRSDFGIGAFLVGVYDAQEDSYKTVAKIGTGLSDEDWRMLHTLCTHIATDHKPALYDVDKLMSVDVWVKPAIVVEIKADEITRSTMHTAGRSMKASVSGKASVVDIQGYALRFPRLKRFVDDKKPEDATTVEEVAEMSSIQLKSV